MSRSEEDQQTSADQHSPGVGEASSCLSPVDASTPPGQRACMQARVAVLMGVPAFSRLPIEVAAVLAESCREERFPADAVVIREGEVGDRLYIVSEGEAEASVGTPDGSAALHTFGPGEMFGELALLDASRGRAATVTTLTPLTALSLSAGTLERVMAEHPHVRAALHAARDDMLLVRFLKVASPFGRLEVERLQWLASRTTVVAVEPGQHIVQQGEVGDACFLLRSGRVEVVLAAPDGSERQIARLGPGTIIGESALLTDTPRNATVRALEPSTVCRVSRADLMDVLGDDRRTAVQMLELVRLRDRPKRVPSVVVQRRATPEGDSIITLKDVSRSRYYRLSPVGLFVWERLDGAHTIRDLTVEHLTTFKSFSPQAIAEIIAGLAVAGFIDTRQIHGDVLAQAVHATRFERLLIRVRRAAEWRVAVKGIDGMLGRVYDSVVWPVYSVPGQIVLGITALAGFVAFLVGVGHAENTTLGGWMLVTLLALYCLSIVCHELGHAFTVKAFGREVAAGGVGWYWFGPIAYVDTSDMWLAGRWPRIAVTLGGLYASFLIAGISSLVATALGHAAAAVLWQLALLSYLVVLINLDPLLEYDGYYILMDWLDRPALRRRSLTWLGHDLPGALRDRAQLRQHRFDLLYGVAAILYVIVMAFVMLAVYRPQITSWLHSVLPGGAAMALGWTLAVAVVALTLISVLSDLRPTAHT